MVGETTAQNDAAGTKRDHKTTQEGSAQYGRVRLDFAGRPKVRNRCAYVTGVHYSLESGNMGTGLC
jgi:hypothetical protein